MKYLSVIDDLKANISASNPLFEPLSLLLEMNELIQKEEYDGALLSAEMMFKTLLKNDDRLSNDFLALLASSLYSLAIIHHKTGANDNAEKDLARSQKIFEKLAKKDNEKFAAALLNTIEATTVIYKSRLKQMNTLAHYQVATATYLEGINQGVKEAGKRLVESLKIQGDTLLEMRQYRESIKYYTKALRYQKKISNTFALPELTISISLGKALINLINRRETGVQLLTSLIPLAHSLNATTELNEITNLLNNRPKMFNISELVKKLFIIIFIISSSTIANAQLLVGHRGSVWGVENTAEAFINGAKAGYQGLECDIKVTKDNVIVISHDDNLKRLGQDTITIANNTAEYLLSLPLKQTRADGKTYEGRLCTLAQYLDICNKYGSFPVIEIKWSKNIFSDNNKPERFNYDGIPALMKLIDQKGFASRAVILTSMKGVLDNINTNYPKVQTQLLTGKEWKQHVDWCKERNIDIDIQLSMDTTDVVKTFHNAGLLLNVWTVNDEAGYNKFKNLGFDFITTDYFIPKK